MTDEDGPREEPMTYAGDTSTLEEGPQGTGAIKIVGVRSPANNRLSSAARQKGPAIRTPRRSSPLVALLLRSSSCFAAVARPALALHTVISSITLQVLFYFLVCSSGLGLVCHVSPFTSWGTSLRLLILFGGGLSLSLGNAASSPCPYSVTGLAIGYIGDSYGLSLVM